MRPRTTVAKPLCIGLIVGTLLQVLPHAHASLTNLFRANSSLRGAGFSGNGVQTLKFQGNSELLLGTNAPNAEIGIMVYDTECGMFGVQPTVSLVAIQKNTGQVLGTLLQFGDATAIYAGNRKVVMFGTGRGGNLVAGAEVDALITVTYEPCSSIGLPTQPTSVTIEPLGTLKPTGTPPFPAPITPDSGSLYIFSDAANAPILEVFLSGQAALPAQSCQLDVSPGSINFGTVALGSNRTETVTLRNNGLVSCTVTSVTRNGSSAFVVGGPAVPFTVSPGVTINIPVTFTPVANGSDSAVLRVSSTDPGTSYRYVQLTGAGSSDSPCEINISPLSLNFGSVEISTNRVLDLTIANSGGTTCTVDNITFLNVSPDFSVNAPTLPFPVAPGTSAIVRVTYTPSDTSADRGILQFNTSDINNRLIMVNLTATGIVATCSLDIGPTALDFGAVVVGTNRSYSVAVTNHSLGICTVNSITPSGSPDFTLAPGIVTPFTLLPGAFTNLTFTYTPTSSGAATNNFTLNSGSPSKNTNIRLTGIGVTVSSNCALLVSQTLLNYGNVALGSEADEKFQISNTGLTNCSIQNLILDGGTNFTLIAPPLPIDLPAFSTVEIAVRFRPGYVGVHTGQLHILNEDLSQPIVPVQLVGVGLQSKISLTATNLHFGAWPVGTEVLQSVWLLNTNAVNATITSITRSGSGDFTLDPIVPTGRFILQPGDSVEVAVLYVPSNQGDDTGTVTINGDFANAPAEISLTGTGLRAQLSVSPTVRNFGAVQLGHTNTLSVTLNNAGNTNTTVHSLRFLGSSLFRVPAPTPPFVVAPGTPVTLDIQYVPRNVETIVILGGAVSTSGNPTVIP